MLQIYDKKKKKLQEKNYVRFRNYIQPIQFLSSVVFFPSFFHFIMNINMSVTSKSHRI